MFYREVGLPSQESRHAAQHPTASKARIEGERTIDQAYNDIDVLTTMSERETGKSENVGVIEL